MVSSKTRRHQELRRLYEAAQRDRDLAVFYEDFNAALDGERNIAAMQDRWSVREIFEQFVPDGREAVNMLRPQSQGGYQLQESAQVVDTSLFANIIGQIMYTSTLKGYTMASLVGDLLVETIQTPFNGEKIPGIGRLGDDLETIPEGGEYPNAIIAEEYVSTPETIKRGLIMDVTREAVFFDRTGVLLNECGMMGERVAVNKEKRILDVVCGIVTIYRRNDQPAEATYQSDNTVTSTALLDWSSIDAVQQKANVQTDPTNGEPISLDLDTVMVPKALEQTGKRIVNASMVRQTTNSNVATYVNDNQLKQSYNLVSGQYVRQRTSSDSTWFAGQPKKAFVYMQNWPLQVTQAAENTEVGFTRDILARFKASERGAAAVRDRRFMFKVTA
jgi:hypothetical protein